MYLFIVLIIFVCGWFAKKNYFIESLSILLSTLFILIIETSNNFYEICDFLTKYSLLNISVLVFIAGLIFLIYLCYKSKKLEIFFMCSILFIKWIPLENTITLILSFVSIIAIYIKYGNKIKLPLIFLTFSVLGLHIFPENNFKPTRLPIVRIEQVTAYDTISIEELKGFKNDTSIYIMPTSTFRANNFPLIISSLYTYSKTDYCLLKTYTNLYNCSYFNIDARKKQRFYKNYGKLTEQDYWQLGRILVERHVKNTSLRNEYLNDKYKLILIGMLEIYNNYKYIYADCNLYSCSNKQIDGDIVKSTCFVDKCKDNNFLIGMKTELLFFIEKRKIQGEILIFPLRNSEYIRLQNHIIINKPF